MSSEKTLNQFTVRPSYYEAVQKLPREKQDKFFAAIFRYGVAGEMPDFGEDEILEMLFVMAQPNIDKSVKFCSSGKNGGRPKGVSNPPKNTPKSDPPKPTPKSPLFKGTQKASQKRDSDSESESESEKSSNKFELAPAGTQERLLPVENSRVAPSSPPGAKPQPPVRNGPDPHVQQLLDWFEAAYGFPPIDKKPRQWAHLIAQKMCTFCRDCGKNPDTATISHALKQFCDWYVADDFRDGTKRLETVFRYFEIWRAEVEGKKQVGSSR